MARTNVVRLNRLEKERGYRFVDRDPFLDELCRLISEDGRSTFQISQRVKELSHNVCTLCPQTLDAWLSGKVKRPTNFLVEWTLLALGYERRVRRIGR
jgi:hypothetical protein